MCNPSCCSYSNKRQCFTVSTTILTCPSSESSKSQVASCSAPRFLPGKLAWNLLPADPRNNMKYGCTLNLWIGRTDPQPKTSIRVPETCAVHAHADLLDPHSTPRNYGVPGPSVGSTLEGTCWAFRLPGSKPSAIGSQNCIRWRPHASTNTNAANLQALHRKPSNY